MKKLLFFGTLVALMAACTSNGNEYTVNLTLPTSEKNGDTLYLTNYDTGDTLATAVVTDSVATFKGSVEGDFIGAVKYARRPVMFVVEAGNITVTSDGKSTGTPLNDAANAMDQTLNEAALAAQEIYGSHISGAIDDETFEAAMDSLQNVYVGAFKETYDANKNNSLGVLAYVGYVEAAELELADIESEIAANPLLGKSAQLTKIVDAMRTVEKTAAGAMFTDFTVTNENGQEQKLSDYVGKGDYVLADFWASWCGPCRAEIPNIKKIYGKYNGKGLTVLGIAVWDKPEDTQKAINELSIPWAQITNAQQVPTDLYGIRGIPHIILFGPDGTIIARDLRGDDMIAMVDEVMSKK